MTDAWKLPAYTRLPSGCGLSTTLPDFDFETYSEAGYIFDPHAKGGIGKWNSITKSPPFGLGAVGAPVYAEHPSTEVLSLAYNLKDGTGEHLWVPGLPPPQNLFDHIERGGLLEAWNSAFEYHIWFNVCMKRLGWPAIHFRQLRDAMAKSRAHAMPGALGEAAAVYGEGSQKLAEGKRLISKFSKPRQPSKNDRRTRNTPRDHPVDAGKFYEYNIGDIRAEADMSAFLPDLSDAELELWLTDQAINFRGVSIDMEAVENCIEIVRQAQARYNAELCELTGGAVTDATKLDALKAWLSTRNIIAPSLAEAPLAELLENPLLAPDIRRALEIRQLLGSESVKKLFSIQRRTSRDGRLRDLFAYCGADRTGRWAGRGPQPQNLPNSGPKVRRCDAIAGCGKHYHASLDACPWCGNPCAFSEPAEWGVGAVDDCLEAIATGVLGEVERCFGDATTAVSGCLRGMFCAAEGHDLICSDYSAIEAVVLAMLAGEQWRIDVFNTHGKIYEMSASTITGVPFAEFERRVEETGQHHPLRKKIGKVAELACFAPDTQVLTGRGYVRIMDVSANDFLWDGVEWVRSEGAVNKGRRVTLEVDGVEMTPDHPISLGPFWKAAKLLASNRSTLRRALQTGSANLPSCASTAKKGRGALLSRALAAARNILSPSLISTRGRPRAAKPAAVEKGALHTSNSTANTPTYSLILSTGAGWLTGYAPPSLGATARTVKAILTTAAEAYRFMRTGAGRTVRAGSSSMYSRLKAGITLRLKWTALTPMAIMPRGTYGLLPRGKTAGISGRSRKCKNASTRWNTVYDIVNAGPRHRFTIKTDSGHLIVHNSGYQGSVGAWKQFGAEEHFESDDAILQAVRAWRKASPQIVKFWYGLEDAARAAIQQPGRVFQCQGIAPTAAGSGITYHVQGDVLYCTLLSGRRLAYHKPRLVADRTPFGREVLKITYEGYNSDYKKGPKGWLRLDTYGGKLAENVTQATARDILAPALVNLERAQYPVVLHIHDEVVCEVPDMFGSVAEVERIMATLPDWARGWPIRAAGGWRGKRYRKD